MSFMVHLLLLWLIYLYRFVPVANVNIRWDLLILLSFPLWFFRLVLYQKLKYLLKHLNFLIAIKFSSTTRLLGLLFNVDWFLLNLLLLEVKVVIKDTHLARLNTLLGGLGMKKISQQRKVITSLFRVIIIAGASSTYRRNDREIGH